MAVREYLGKYIGSFIQLVNIRELHIGLREIPREYHRGDIDFVPSLPGVEVVEGEQQRQDLRQTFYSLVSVGETGKLVGVYTETAYLDGIFAFRGLQEGFYDQAVFGYEGVGPA